MQDIETKIQAALEEVAAVRGLLLPEIRNHHHLSSDLGLKSLDLAHLVALLEARLDADPFAHLVPITSVRTVGDLYSAYRKCFQPPGEKTAPPSEQRGAGAARRLMEQESVDIRRQSRHSSVTRS